MFRILMKTRYGEIMHLMSLCQATRICGIIHTRLIDNKGSAFWDSVTDGGLNIREIVVTSNDMSSTTPKKKSMIYLEKRDVKEKTEIWRVNLAEDTKLVVPSEEN